MVVLAPPSHRAPLLLATPLALVLGLALAGLAAPTWAGAAPARAGRLLAALPVQAAAADTWAYARDDGPAREQQRPLLDPGAAVSGCEPETDSSAPESVKLRGGRQVETDSPPPEVLLVEARPSDAPSHPWIGGGWTPRGPPTL